MKRDNEDSLSLNKYISSTGLCSRREADKMIEAGRVSINNRKAALGNRVLPGDEVTIDGDVIESNVKSYYVAYNKPIGVVSTTDPKEKQNIAKYINHEERLFPIGRLDKDSEGLILLTNDGDIVNKILRSENKHEKEYIVTVDKVVTPKFIEQMSKGVPILGSVTQKCIVTKVDEYRFNIVLTQGLNRQIRRMCSFLNYDVLNLKRVRIMSIELGKLKTGHWRVLNTEEVGEIKESVKDSRKTAPTKSKKVRKYKVYRKKSIEGDFKAEKKGNYHADNPEQKKYKSKSKSITGQSYKSKPKPKGRRR